MVADMDDVYRRPGYYWGKEPNPMASQVIELLNGEDLQGKRLLDLGCGEGRDMVLFAKNGLDVDGVDTSQFALKKARRWAREEGLRINVKQGDIANLQLEHDFFIIYSSGTLTYLPPQIREETFDGYKGATVYGGFHAFNVFVEKPYFDTPPDWGADEYFYRSGELLHYYWNWEIVSFQEKVIDCMSGGVPHRHATNVMFARKR